jgi:Na+/proline symporter
MFLPRCTARSALPAVLTGLAVSITWSYWHELTGRDEVPTITLSIAVPCITAFLLATVLSLLVERGGDHPGRAFTWYAVMKRPVPPPTAR